jgi:hypothetical protein
LRQASAAVQSAGAVRRPGELPKIAGVAKIDKVTLRDTLGRTGGGPPGERAAMHVNTWSRSDQGARHADDGHGARDAAIAVDVVGEGPDISALAAAGGMR